MSVPFNRNTKQILDNIPYFHGLEEVILRRVADEIQVRKYEAGKILFLHDDSNCCAFFYRFFLTTMRANLWFATFLHN